MKPEIYVDTFFIVNFLTDLACLAACKGILSLPAPKKRLAAGAAVGALFSLTVLWTGPSRWTVLAAWTAGPLISLLVAFGKQRLPRLALSWSVCLGGAFAAGGTVQALTSLVGELTGEKKAALTAIMLGATVTFTAFRLFAKSAAAKISQARATVKITAFGKTKRMIGLCDSGNLLREPISGFPVLILSKTGAVDLVPAGYAHDQSPPDSNFFAVPLKTISSSRLIYGFKPDSVSVSGALRRKPRVTDRVIVAFDDKNEDFSGCGCLVPSQLL